MNNSSNYIVVVFDLCICIHFCFFVFICFDFSYPLNKFHQGNIVIKNLKHHFSLSGLLTPVYNFSYQQPFGLVFLNMTS